MEAPRATDQDANGWGKVMFERLSAATVRPDSSSDDRPVHRVLRRCVRIASPASFAHNAEPGLDSNGERLLAGTTFFPSQFARIKNAAWPVASQRG